MLTAANYMDTHINNQENCWSCGVYTRVPNQFARRCRWWIIRHSDLRFLCNPCATFEALQ